MSLFSKNVDFLSFDAKSANKIVLPWYALYGNIFPFLANCSEWGHDEWRAKSSWFRHPNFEKIISKGTNMLELEKKFSQLIAWLDFSIFG